MGKLRRIVLWRPLNFRDKLVSDMTMHHRLLKEISMRAYYLFLLFIVFLAGCDSNAGLPNNGLTTTTAGPAPTVVWTDPLPSAVGPNIITNNTVRMSFSTLMDTRSVIRGVSISPLNEGVFIDTNTVIPLDGYTFWFPLTPTSAWLVYATDTSLNSRFPSGHRTAVSYYKVGQVYTMTLDSLIHDIYGDYFVPGSFSFTPEPNLRVMDTYPESGDTAVSPGISSIAVRFNSPIDTTSARNSFALSPAVAGTANVYYSTWGLSWSPPSGVTLASATVYTVTIAATVKDVYGNLLSLPYSFSFTTGN
jgi:hypothetical protein